MIGSEKMPISDSEVKVQHPTEDVEVKKLLEETLMLQRRRTPSPPPKFEDMYYQANEKQE